MKTLIVDNGDCNCETCQIARGIHGIEITPQMIHAYDEAEEAAPGTWYDQTRAGLRAALEAAGFTVTDGGEPS